MSKQAKISQLSVYEHESKSMFILNKDEGLVD